MREFQRQFASEEACQTYLAACRWPDGFACPRCGHTRGYRLMEHRRWQCVACRYQVSLTAGTILHNTKTPLAVWFWAAYLTVTEPVRVKHYRSDDPARELLIFLPGIGDVLEDYESRGFIDAAHKSGVALDITVADMHFGYYVTRTAVERLRDDIVLPAQAEGYSRISLAGIWVALAHFTTR